MKLMDPENHIRIRSYSNQITAELARGALEAEGIATILLSDDLGGTHPHFQMTLGIQLLVHQSDKEQALAILEEIEKANLDDTEFESDGDIEKPIQDKVLQITLILFLIIPLLFKTIEWIWNQF
jgi:hypothetical protein